MEKKTKADGFIRLIIVALVLLCGAPLLMSMTCTHTPPVGPTADAAGFPDAQPPTPIDGAVPTPPCGIQAALIDDVANATFNALQDAANSQSRLNTLANQYTHASIACLVNKIVAGTPNASATIERANQWLGLSAKKK